MPELQLYNAFGLISIKRHQIIGHLAAIEPDGHAIESTLADEIPDGIEMVKEGEIQTFLIAAYLEPEGKSRIGFLPHGDADPALRKTPEVKLFLRKLVKKIRRAPYFVNEHPMED